VETSKAVGASNVYEIIEHQKAMFSQVLSVESITWDKEKQFAIQALQANKMLNDTAWKNQASLQNAIINVASIGISLNPALKHAYLVPRGSAVCLDISYMGLLSLAQKSGAIAWGQAKLVYKNDDYTNTGIDTAPTHHQKTFGDKGEIVGVYCTVKLPSGDYLTEEMDIETIEKIKSASKAANGPWKMWFTEMARKAVVKRASKYWPQSDSVSTAVDMLNQQEGNNEPIQTSPEVKDYTPDQKEYYDQLITNSDSIAMFVLLTTVEETVKTNLYHSFIKGEKGKYQRIVDDLYRKGAAQISDCITVIEENLGGDDSAVLEIIEGFDNDTLKIIEDRLNPEMVMEFNKIKGLS